MSEEGPKLASAETYISVGIQVGTRFKSKYMEQFIYRTRPDGVNIIDINKVDERLRIAAKFLSYFDPSKILVVASRAYSIKPVIKFCELTGAQYVVGRFLPGTLTNPRLPQHMEPDVIFVNDPVADRQAVEEASIVGIPVVALCDTEHTCSMVDLVIPTNNKGKKALAMIYWLLARQVLRERGELPPDGDLPVSVEEFEAELT